MYGLKHNMPMPPKQPKWLGFMALQMIVGAFFITIIRPFGHAQYPLANLLGEEIVTTPISNNMKCLH